MKVRNLLPGKWSLNHSTVHYQNKLIIFGGKNRKGKAINQTVIYDIATN